LISPKDFWKPLKKNGYDYFSGVPCNLLTGILDCALNDKEIVYIPAVKENVALGIASGAYLAGRKSGILIQNSGLGNIINTLSSFNLIYKIPVLMFITWRGYEGNDAPQHIIMGKKMLGLLEQLEIPTIILSEDYGNEIQKGIKLMEKESIPVAMVLKKA
jgi:sulfopyruvate decarboxylase subunit alpha